MRIYITIHWELKNNTSRKKLRKVVHFKKFVFEKSVATTAWQQLCDQGKKLEPVPIEALNDDTNHA